MTKWDTKWSDEQRKAIVRAFIDLRIRPMTKITRMAAAGELSADAGADPLPGFDIPYGTVVSIGRTAEKRARGENMRPALRAMPARDRAEDMQRRLTSILDRELERIELAQRKRPKTPADAEQIRKVVRAMRELATLPDFEEKRLPKVLGERADGRATEGPSRDSLAGKLLAASDQSMSPSTRTQATTYGTERQTEDPPRRDEQTLRANDVEQSDDVDGGDDDAGLSPHEPITGLASDGVLVSAAPTV